MCFNFLWDGKGDKIKRDIMISDYNNGGLRMVDIKLFNKALKFSWITKYLDSGNHGKWKLLFDLESQPFGGEEFFEVTLVEKIYQNTSKYRIPLFQKYYESGRTLNMRLTEQLKAQNLWQNSLIRVGNPYSINHGLQKELETWVI